MKRPDIKTIKENLMLNDACDVKLIKELIDYVEFLESQQEERVLTTNELVKRMQESFKG